MNWEIKKYPAQYFTSAHSYSSRSAVVGNLIFLSGTTGSNPETGEVSPQFEKQVTASLDSISSALEEAGSSLNNLIKTCFFLKSIADCPRLWQTLREYYKNHDPELVVEPPACCICEVSSLANPEYLVEIDAIAVVSKNMPAWEVKKFPLRSADIKPGMSLMSESVQVGNLLFLSAMDGSNPTTGRIETAIFEEQWHIALGKARAALERASSSMSNIIKTLHFQSKVEGLLAGAQDIYRSNSPASDRLWRAELEYFDKHAPHLMDDPPASTFLKVPSLTDRNALGQTDIIGVISMSRPGWNVRKYPAYIGRRGFPRHLGDIKKYYANAVRVGNLVIVSGQTAVDVYTARIETDVFEEQMRTALMNLKECLEETGSSLENVVKTTILLPDPSNTHAMRKVEFEFYKIYAPRLLDSLPASTVVHPLALASPKLLVEIEAIACIPLAGNKLLKQ